LNLSANWDFDAAAAQALFSSERFRSLVHLDLNSTRIGTAGAMALASAKGWDRLRSLNLSEVGMGNDGLRALLASPNLKHLTWLTIGGSQPGEPTLDVTPVLAAELTQLPHLASLRLRVPRCDPRSRQILLTSDSLAWPLIDCYDDWDIQSHRANLSPARWPPVDEATERYAEW
jgi:hypothetical protein